MASPVGWMVAPATTPFTVVSILTSARDRAIAIQSLAVSRSSSCPKTGLPWWQTGAEATGRRLPDKLRGRCIAGAQLETRLMTLRPNDLHRPGSAVPLVPYLKSMWSFRRYAVALAKARVESTNAETALGRVWLLGEPLLFIAVY